MGKTNGGQGKRCGNCGAVGVAQNARLCTPCKIERDEGPEAKHEYLSRIGSKGGLNATRGRRLMKGLDAGDLPPLTSRAEALQWLHHAAHGVATGQLTASEGEVIHKLVKEFLQVLDSSGGGDDLEAYLRGRYGKETA